MTKTRVNPKVWCEQEILNPENKREVIGKIMLVSYLTKTSPHLEFFIKDEFEHLKNQGIMSARVVKYLKFCKKWGHNKLLATVKKNNAASIKILEKNNFIRMMEVRDNYCYMVDLTFTKEKYRILQELVDKEFNRKKNE
tara:strand:- start:230 stop:646 length:417 start_codon:yes stop_codon:yes gene_type:complete